MEASVGTAIPKRTEIAPFTWNEAAFVDYIKDPKLKIPGTKKLFPGIKDETEAQNLWSYLKQFGPRWPTEVVGDPHNADFHVANQTGVSAEK